MNFIGMELWNDHAMDWEYRLLTWWQMFHQKQSGSKVCKYT